MTTPTPFGTITASGIVLKNRTSTSSTFGSIALISGAVPSNLSNYTYTWPPATPTASGALSSDNTGILSWIENSAAALGLSTTSFVPGQVLSLQLPGSQYILATNGIVANYDTANLTVGISSSTRFALSTTASVLHAFSVSSFISAGNYSPVVNFSTAGSGTLTLGDGRSNVIIKPVSPNTTAGIQALVTDNSGNVTTVTYGTGGSLPSLLYLPNDSTTSIIVGGITTNATTTTINGALNASVLSITNLTTTNITTATIASTNFSDSNSGVVFTKQIVIHPTIGQSAIYIQNTRTDITPESSIDFTIIIPNNITVYSKIALRQEGFILDNATTIKGPVTVDRLTSLAQLSLYGNVIPLGTNLTLNLGSMNNVFSALFTANIVMDSGNNDALNQGVLNYSATSTFVPNLWSLGYWSTFYGDNHNPTNFVSQLAVYGNTLGAQTATLVLFGPNALKFGGGGSWITTSDRRLKQDITDFSDGLEVINRIRTRRYKLIQDVKRLDKKAPEYIGVIAQELLPVWPHAIDTSDPERYTFDASDLTFLLINAVKTLSAEVELLKARLPPL